MEKSMIEKIKDIIEILEDILDQVENGVKPPGGIISIGQVYKVTYNNTSKKVWLVQAAPSSVIFIDPIDCGWFTKPLMVGNVRNITEDEMEVLLKVWTYEYVCEVKDIML